jgi:hypothetical protein
MARTTNTVRETPTVSANNLQLFRPFFVPRVEEGRLPGGMDRAVDFRQERGPREDEESGLKRERQAPTGPQEPSTRKFFGSAGALTSRRLRSKWGAYFRVLPIHPKGGPSSRAEDP